MNVSTGNLIVEEDDISVKERGIDLDFSRTYNSQSNHDYSSSDNSLPSNFGNGWTSTFDAHLSYNAAANVMTVWDDSGARYDYSSDGQGHWIAPAGVHSQLYFDGGCGYLWVAKDGTEYDFSEPDYSTACPGASAPLYNAYNGRLYEIIARNHNNFIQFTYSWDNGDASLGSHLDTIVAAHSDGQNLTLQFADFSGYRELASVTRPDGAQSTYQYDANGNPTWVTLPTNNSNYGSHGHNWNANHQLSVVVSPVSAENAGSKGATPAFYYDAGNRLTGMQMWGIVNFTPDDGIAPGIALQAGSQSAEEINYTTFSYASTGETQVTDRYGHAANWWFDSAGRVTEEDDWTGASTNTWLRAYATWDTSLNVPIETVDERSLATDYGWDGNGNLLWVQEPQVQTSQGSGRPVTRYSYDQYNNLLSYCDAVYVWNTGATSCPTTGGTVNYRWTSDNGTDANEPYGRLTDVYTARGYHRWIQYNAANEGGGTADYGLPTDAYGDCITQNDATSRCTHISVVYNSLGDVTSENTGAGTWSLGYDGLNRMNVAVDPDGVTNCTWYYQNGQVEWHESPSERAASGQSGQCGTPATGQPTVLGTPDSTAQYLTYDADGNELTVTHHFNNVATTTTNWYDGVDRLVEVALPQDPNDIFSHWLTRYIYDISDSSSSGQFGNLASVQRYTPNEITQTGTTVSAGYAWVPVKTWKYDRLDRPTAYSYYSPGATAMSTNTWTWDSRGAGLLAAFSDAAGDSVTYSYDAVGNITQRDYGVVNSLYSGSLPSEQMTYDPDGRIEMYDNTEVGPAFITYDAVGNIASYKEPTGGSGTPLGGGITGAISDPTTYTYQYYSDDMLQELSASSSALSSYTQKYNYRIDGLLESQESSAAWTQSGSTYSDDYGWNESFSPTGRVTYKSDSIADPCPQSGCSSGRHVMSYCNSGCTQGGALNVVYDAYGRINSWQIPAGTYSGFQYDAEGEPTHFNAASQQWTLGYSTRGELLAQGATQTNLSSSYRSADGFLYPQMQECATSGDGGITQCGVPTETFDTRNGALTATQQYKGGLHTVFWATTNYSYDAAGRRSTQEYDALNRLLRAGATGYAYGPGTIPISRASYTNHSTLGETPIYTTDSSGNVRDIKLGANDDILPNDTSFSGLTVYDRDPFGFVATARNSTGTSAWTIPSMYSTCSSLSTVAGATTGFVSTPMTNCQPGGMLHAFRTDGYFDGTLTMRGVRAYTDDTEQWSTPDMYQGMASDPMSGLGYNYANNNPAMFTDPSGFCGTVTFNYSNGNVSYHMPGVCPDTAFNNCEIGCYGGGPSAMMIDMLNERLGRLMNNPCVRDALRSGGLTIGVDVVGFVPVAGGLTKLGKIAKGAGAVERVVGHQLGYIGIVATQQGGKLLQGVSGTASLVLSAPGASQGDKQQMVAAALGLGTFIPGVGDYIAGVQLAIDVGATKKAVHDCVAH